MMCLCFKSGDKMIGGDAPSFMRDDSVEQVAPPLCSQSKLLPNQVNCVPWIHFTAVLQAKVDSDTFFLVILS
jgi:hypothetical protein